MVGQGDLPLGRDRLDLPARAFRSHGKPAIDVMRQHAIDLGRYRFGRVAGTAAGTGYDDITLVSEVEDVKGWGRVVDAIALGVGSGVGDGTHNAVVTPK